jgi:hypothetical protein
MDRRLDDGHILLAIIGPVHKPLGILFGRACAGARSLRHDRVTVSSSESFRLVKSVRASSDRARIAAAQIFNENGPRAG